MRQKTLLLFQLFLLTFAFYALLEYSGNHRLLVSLACLVGAFLGGKVETRITDRRQQEDGQGDDMRKKDKVETARQALECLLTSKNVLLLTDAVHYVLHDLGLAVMPCQDHPGVERLVKVPGMEVTYGLKILGDVEELNQTWDKWEELASFDQGKGGKRRLLIISSNCKDGAVDSQHEYKDFSVNTELLLSARRVVAMTTLTLSKIYLLCKKRKVDIARIFRPIHHHPGGVFRLENFAW
jgi:hypothetical protein